MHIRRTKGLAIVICLALGLTSLPTQAATQNRVFGVRLVQDEQVTVVEIASDRAPNFTTFKQDSPRRVIVDIAECALGSVPTTIGGDGGLVQGITTAQYGEAPHGISRVIIQLQREAEYQVKMRGSSLFVHLTAGTGGLLVSAGIPMAPPEDAVVSGSYANQNRQPSSHDMALAEELARPKAVPVVDPQPEPSDGSAPGQGSTAVVAAPSPQSSARPGLKPPAEPEAVTEPVQVAIAQPNPEPENDAEPVAAVSAAMMPDQRPEPVQLAMVTSTRPEPLPHMPATEAVIEQKQPNLPVALVQEDGEEELDEVEEVPVNLEEEDEAPPPPPMDDEVPVEADASEQYDSESAAPPPVAEVEERVELSSAIKAVTWVGFQQTRQSSRVFVRTNEPVSYRVSEEGDNFVVIELDNARIPMRNNRRFLDTHFFDSAVTLITPREIEGVSRSVRIEIQIKGRVPYRAGREDNVVYVDFDRPQ